MRSIATKIRGIIMAVSKKASEKKSVKKEVVVAPKLTARQRKKLAAGEKI